MVQGFAHDRYAKVRAVFSEHLAHGADVGASFCATVDGETVVDLWGGYADASRTRAWDRDTIVNVFSTTKTMTNLTALLLADRGALDLDAPVARYWPEFAANGKGGVLVRHVLGHTAGLSGWREPVSGTDLYDWEKVTELLAAQAPYWVPGTAPGYHGTTQGYLVGEVVRRVTGQSLGSVFRQEIAEPLEADFYIGLPESEDFRVADLIPPADQRHSGSLPSLLDNMLTNPPVDVAATRTRAWRAAEIPAIGGMGNARAIAEVHAILANGGVAKGHRFMSEAGARKAFDLQGEGLDVVMGIPARFGLGFGLGDGSTFGRNTLYWGGFGGSMAVIDPEARATYGYAMNKMVRTTTGDNRALSLIRAVSAAITG
ncbi:beta-lactamase family protein [Actinoplanes sp. TBRC 11911]|nr:beta-lactamase family protein [Actinoplanes sp. TBRC 11911]